MGWVDCAKEHDARTCAQAYVESQASKACAAAVATSTAGAGAVAGAVACEYLAPKLARWALEKVWPLVGGVAGAVDSVVDAMIGAFAPSPAFDRYHAVVDHWAHGAALLGAAKAAAREQAASQVLGAFPLAIRSPEIVFDESLRVSPPWTDPLELSDGQGHRVRFDYAEPHKWRVIEPVDFSVIDVSAIWALADAGLQVRASALPMAAAVAVAVSAVEREAAAARRAELDARPARLTGAAICAGLGVGALVALVRWTK